MFADVAVSVNPKDKRYIDLVGKTVIVPFVQRKVPVIADDAVDKNFGSGVLKIDPAHSLVDFEIGKRHNLEVISVIGKDGRLNEKTGKFSGYKSKEVREIIFADLQKMGLIEKVKNLKHKVPICERCKSKTELLISEEWFVKVKDLADEAAKVIKSNKIKFLPRNYAKIIVDWLEQIHDWCISRSLWWGHRIPVWYLNGEMKVSDKSPGDGWKQDEQVLDTWFSSGLWPLSTLGWPFVADAPQDKPSEQKPGFGPELTKYYPWDFEISAPEIKYLWIARMIMIGQYFTKKAPFKTMFFHGMLRDLQGRKFSKSLGNGIEPTYLIERWGTDATRMALYSYSIPGRDGRVSKELLDSRCKNFRNFETKLKNITRFILELKPDNSKNVLNFKNKDDQLINSQLEKIIKKSTKLIEEAKLHLATDKLYDFVWHKFADIYIEKSKERREEAQPVLEYVLKIILILLHPFMPFITEELYQKFGNKKKSIMLEKWPS